VTSTCSSKGWFGLVCHDRSEEHNHAVVTERMEM
jgi:hypothetical protein